MEKIKLIREELVKYHKALQELCNVTIDDSETSLKIGINLSMVEGLVKAIEKERSKKIKLYGQKVNTKDSEGNIVEGIKLVTLEAQSSYQEWFEEFMKGEEEIQANKIRPSDLKGTEISFHEATKIEKPVVLSSGIFAYLKPILILD